MNVYEYLNKSTSITLLDTLLIAIAASIMSPIIVLIAKKIFGIFHLAISKIIGWIKYKKRLKKGNLNYRDLKRLEEKEEKGELSKKEREALGMYKQKMLEAMKDLNFEVPKMPEIPIMRNNFKNPFDP
ncbi:hypothetical protein NOM01_11100 [Sporolactobacillus sp. STSJ-5]|uniref:hypothetical protein n=1 Tax=Sporolactobacillus sp. STSJ-5 TaxID=2965076 RepID=UPI0021067000|nr:hypothetical protein [Sporolactobacillus sp. STSJ-5]MCQ2010563.1 hypothetical protein [Sporolactobacillus sp. STSJ-5]